MASIAPAPGIHRGGVARGEQVGQVLHRECAARLRRESAIHAQVAGIGRRGDGRQRRRRTTPWAACGYLGCSGKAIFQSTAILYTGLGRFDPVVGDAIELGLGIDRRGRGGLRKMSRLRLVQVAVALHAGGFLDAVSVVQQHAQVADAAHAGFGAHRGLARLDARGSRRCTSRPCRSASCSRSFFVRAARDAHAPAPALVLVDERQCRLPRACRSQPLGHEATHAGFRQCSHRRGRYIMKVFSNWPYISFCTCSKFTSMFALWQTRRPGFLPVRAPLDFFTRWPVIRLRGRAVGAAFISGAYLQVVVVEGEGLVVVVDLRQVGVGEDLHQHLPLAALARAMEPSAWRLQPPFHLSWFSHSLG